MSLDSKHRRRFGPYVLLDVVGAGATAQVWSAYRSPSRRERFAIKILRRPLDASTRRTTERELRSLALAENPAIVRVEDVVVDGEHLGIVMELCRGSLGDWLRVHGPLPAFWVARIGIDALAALDAAHRGGVLHRDVKPGNLLVAQDGSIKLADFGIAKLLDEGTTASHTSAIWGTMPFVAPERRYSRPVDQRADLYSLATTLACLAVGEPVGELFVPTVRERLVARLPRPLCDVLVRAGSYAPDDRFPDAASMAAALQSIRDTLPGRDLADLRELAPLPTLDTRGPTDPIETRGRRGLLGLMLVGGVTLAGGFGLGLLFENDAEREHDRDASLPRCEMGSEMFRAIVRPGPRETNDGAAADIDRDGRIDLVFANQLDETLSIYWGGGGEPLTDPVEIGIGRSPARPATGDVDGDGYADLVIARPDDSQILLLRGRSDRTFEPDEPIFQSPTVWRLGLVDWDQDGVLDLLMQTITQDGCTAWRRGLGDGRFAPHVCIGPGSELADPYGHHPPAVYRRADDGALVRHRRGNGVELAPSEPVADLEALGVFAMQVFVRDLDGDGADEIYAPARARETPSLLRIDAGGHACELWSPLGFEPSTMVDVADVDGDGLIDVVGRASCSGCTSNHIVLLGVAP
jgi:tRNA A-37 threonylcarbamoyl transferase component Bud32